MSFNFVMPETNIGSGKPTLVTKTITANGTYAASSDNADGYSSVTVNTPVINNTTLSIIPTTTTQTLTPANPYTGYSTVNVSSVTASIDNNITAGNIKKDVSILGVTGTYEGSGGGGTTYSYPQLKGGNYYVLNDETVVPMSFYTVKFNGRSSSYDVSVFTTCQGVSVGMYDTTWECLEPNTTAVFNNVVLANAAVLEGKTIKHISIGFPQTNITSVTFNGYAFQNISTLESVSISNMNNLKTVAIFRNCTNLTEVDVSSIDAMVGAALSGTPAVGGAFSGCTSLQTLSFNSLKSTSFGSYTNQFDYMLKGVTGCTVHFPSNLQSVIGSWDSVTTGFGGTNTTVLFDLPATV